MLTRRRFGALALAALSLLAACGGSDVKKADPKKAALAATTTSTSTTVPLPVGRPKRVVSLSPSATETLFAIGADDQVVAVDSNSNYPAKAPRTDLNAFEPNVEAIASYKPDLVITDGTNKQLLQQLNALGIATMAAAAPKSLNGVFLQIEQIGAVTGNIAQAGALATDLEAQVQDILSGIPKHQGSLRYYYELDNTYFSASSKTFIGSIFNQLGMRNIADKVDNKKSAGYPQLTPEFIVKENPDVIFLADSKCCQQNAESVAARPGWGAIRAVQEGHVIALDDDVASRWGPRVVQLLKTIASSVKDITPVADYSDSGS